MRLRLKNKNQIKKHATQQSPKECCGLIVFNDRVEIVQAKNLSESPNQHFFIDPKSYLYASHLGEIKGIYHSHLNNPKFSEMDKQNSERTKLWNVLYNITDDSFHSYWPKNYKYKYCGRAFQIGIMDCYTLVQNYYEAELKVKLKKYTREENWSKEAPILFNKEFSKNGLVEVKNPRKHDIITIKGPNEKIATHLLIYLGNNEILHHPRFGESTIEIYSSIYRRLTEKILRYGV